MVTKLNNLRPCVDCGNKLSPTATSCPNCSSNDPFGVRRADDKMKGILFIVAIIAGALLFAAWKFTGTTPMDIIRGDFHKIWQR
jgi:hypothetical protein